MKSSLKLLIYISLIFLGLQAVAEAGPVTTTINRNYSQGRGITRTYIRQDLPTRRDGYYHQQRPIIYQGGQNYDCDHQPYTRYDDYHYRGRYNQNYPSGDYSNYPQYYPEYGEQNQYYPSGNSSNYPQYYPNQNPPYYPEYSVPVIGY